MSDSNFDLIDKPWVRLILPPACALGFAVLIVGTLFGVDEVQLVWKKIPTIYKLLAGVLGSVYLLASYTSSLTRHGLISSWSDRPLSIEQDRYKESELYDRFYDRYASERYGMNETIFWPRLFISLPTDAKNYLNDVRNTYITAHVFSTYFLNIFKLIGPTWCGVLILFSVASKSAGFAWMALALMFFYWTLELVNLKSMLVFGRFQLFYSFMSVLAYRNSRPTYLLRVAAGMLLLFCWAMFKEHTVYLETDLLIIARWNLSFLTALTVTFEIIGIGILAQTCRLWFISTGVVYMQTTASMFDLYRRTLAINLGLTLPTNISEEKILWKEHEELLRKGDKVEYQLDPAFMNMLRKISTKFSKGIVNDFVRIGDIAAKTYFGKLSFKVYVGSKSLNLNSGLCLALIVELSRAALVAGLLHFLVEPMHLGQVYSSFYILFCITFLYAVVFPIITFSSVAALGISFAWLETKKAWSRKSAPLWWTKFIAWTKSNNKKIDPKLMLFLTPAIVYAISLFYGFTATILGSVSVVVFLILLFQGHFLQISGLVEGFDLVFMLVFLNRIFDRLRNFVAGKFIQTLFATGDSDMNAGDKALFDAQSLNAYNASIERDNPLQPLSNPDDLSLKEKKPTQFELTDDVDES